MSDAIIPIRSTFERYCWTEAVDKRLLYALNLYHLLNPSDLRPFAGRTAFIREEVLRLAGVDLSSIQIVNRLNVLHQFSDALHVRRLVKYGVPLKVQRGFSLYGFLGDLRGMSQVPFEVILRGSERQMGQHWIYYSFTDSNVDKSIIRILSPRPLYPKAQCDVYRGLKRVTSTQLSITPVSLWIGYRSFQSTKMGHWVYLINTNAFSASLKDDGDYTVFHFFKFWDQACAPLSEAGITVRYLLGSRS